MYRYLNGENERKIEKKQKILLGLAQGNIMLSSFALFTVEVNNGQHMKYFHYSFSQYLLVLSIWLSSQITD